MVIPVIFLEEFEPAFGPGDHFAVHEDPVLGDALGVELEAVFVVFLPVAAGLEQMVDLGGNGGCPGFLEFDHAPGVAHFFAAIGEFLDDHALEFRGEAGMRSETAGVIEVEAEFCTDGAVGGVAIAPRLGLLFRDMAFCGPFFKGFCPESEMDHGHRVVGGIIEDRLDPFSMCHNRLPGSGASACDQGCINLIRGSTSRYCATGWLRGLWATARIFRGRGAARSRSA